ncbi:hypothetical protein GF420_12550 [candidate division GN15 bacterium]|nr:hypothetical protein [candidate division GN15 bacterium]
MDRRPPEDLSDHPHRRHQWQGLDRGDARCGPSRSRLSHRPVYLAAPGEFSRTDEGQRAADLEGIGSALCRPAPAHPGKKKLSFFELVTALALDHFARQEVDIAVIETGLGGRLDATNVLQPILTVTTDISRDHVEILGSSIRKIAWEKAGIIKPDVPHLIGTLPPEAERVIRDVCKKQHAPLFRVRKSRMQIDGKRLQLSYHTDRFRVERLAPSLPGSHQLRNLALVLEACTIVRDRGFGRVSKKAIVSGVRQIDWPGRFQVIRNNGSPTLVLDVAHNARGMEAFVDSFERVFPGRRATVIVGFVKRKPHQAMFDSLSRIAHSYALVPLSNKRTIDMAEMMASLKWRGIDRQRFGSVRTAYNRVLKNAEPDDIIIVVGSHYLVGEFLTLIGWT